MEPTDTWGVNETIMKHYNFLVNLLITLMFMNLQILPTTFHFITNGREHPVYFKYPFPNPD